MTDAPQKIRLCDVQHHFGIHSTTARRWAAKGLVKIYKLGRLSFIDVAELNALIEKGDG